MAVPIGVAARSEKLTVLDSCKTISFCFKKQTELKTLLEDIQL